VTIKVFVDANLLFYKLISDLLFDASNLGLIEAYWSETVIAEYLEHGPRVLNKIRRSKGLPENLEAAQVMLQNKVILFREHSGFIFVEEYEDIKIPEGALNDKDDAHILKAALKAKCSVLLTLDKDFRKISSIADLEIVAKKADDFFCELFDKDEDQMMDVINKTRDGLGRQKGRKVNLIELVEMMKSGCLIGLSQKLNIYLHK